ncbi:MAG: HigA family addiction module antitoxin [Pirellulaceae bacterium]
MARIPRNEPTHPGTMLREEFLEPLGLSQSELARRIRVSFPRVNELVNGKRGVTPDTALRLSRLLGTTPDFWMNLQLTWDLWHAVNSEQAAEIEEIEPLNAA